MSAQSPAPQDASASHATWVLSTRSRSGIPDNAVWRANTDADTSVPDNWLATRIQFAEPGFVAVIGTAMPNGLDSQAECLWRERHRLDEGHNHVHGANLGLRASTYIDADGFAAVSLSGRTRSRVDGGFASYIADLGSRDSTWA